VYNIEVGSRAKFEIEEAFDYYNNLPNDRLGEKFLNDYLLTIELLEINPFFQKRLNNYRVIPLNKFPFILIYVVLEEENLVFIESVFHTSQNPKKYP
jgi:toxin ParE1/3/4